jgi:hypothetical protein
MNAADAARFAPDSVVGLQNGCTHMLGSLPCVNPAPHKGGGRGCIHISGSFVPRASKEE